MMTKMSQGVSVDRIRFSPVKPVDEFIYVLLFYECFTCILTFVTQPLSLQSMLSGALAPEAPVKRDGALWRLVGGVSVAKDCRISSAVCEREDNN